MGNEDTAHKKDIGKQVTLEMIKEWRTGLEVVNFLNLHICCGLILSFG